MGVAEGVVVLLRGGGGRGGGVGEAGVVVRLWDRSEKEGKGRKERVCIHLLVTFGDEVEVGF